MKARILVIEDEMSINDLLCMNLEIAGYETVGYLDGNEAYEAIMPCKAAVVIEGNEIYIPISQAQDLCREIGEPSEISKVYLKINGKNNLENAKKILSGI